MPASVTDSLVSPVKKFAEVWRVSVSTVMRDLAAFRKLGQDMVVKHVDYGIREYFHHYADCIDPLFTCNR